MEWLSGAVREVIVYRSVATSVFSNLALEDWIFENVDLSARRVLLLWRNSPSVVIGRHQNPWLETNIPLLRSKGVSLARRRSGGGAVYHDLGNLNVTVFTHRHDYKRPRNLQLVCDAVNKQWGASLHSNKRDDIMYNSRWKVSGSAAKLAKNSAYHHFTLLLDSDRANLHTCLRPHPSLHPSRSTATSSQRSEVVNLCALHPDMSYEAVVEAIAKEFYTAHRIPGHSRKEVEVDPASEGDFPGIHDMQSQLEKWEWVCGKTPKFSFDARKEFDFGNVTFAAELVGGVLQSPTLQVTAPGDVTVRSTLDSLSTALQGTKFSRKELLELAEATDNASTSILHWISQLT